MGTLFHAFDDLLTFGTVIIIAMIVGGALVIITMLADSVWLIRAAHQQHRQEDALHLSTSGQGSEPPLKKSA